MFRGVGGIAHLLFLSLACLLALPGHCVRGQDVDETLALLDGSLQAIKSFDVKIDVTVQFLMVTKGSEQMVDGRPKYVVTSQRKLLPGETPDTIKIRNRQVLQRGKGRMEFFDDLKEQPNRFSVYDDEVEKAWTPAERTASISRPAVPGAGDGMDYRESYLTVLGAVHWLKCFHQRKKTVRVKRGFPDDSLVIVEAPPADRKAKVDLSDWGLRLTIDTRHGFMPSIMETFKVVDGKISPYTRRTVTSWKSVGDVWVPTQLVSQHFDQDPQWKETFGKVNNEAKMVVDLSRSSWNQEIADEVFELPLPKGTTVIDFLRNVRYMTGAADPGKNLDDLAAHALDVVPINTWQQKPGNPWLLWSGIGGSLLLLAGLGYVFVLRRQKKIRGA